MFSQPDSNLLGSAGVISAVQSGAGPLRLQAELPYVPSLPQFDIKNRRTFLKRTDYPSVRLSDIYLGAVITVFSRQLTIKDYGDGYTAKVFGAKLDMYAQHHPQHLQIVASLPLQCSFVLVPANLVAKLPRRTVACVPAETMQRVGNVIDAAGSTGLKVVELRMLHLLPEQSSALFPDSSDAAACCKGPVMAMKLTAEDAGAKWGKLVGDAAAMGQKVTAPANDSEAQKQAEYLFGGSCPLLRPKQADQSSLLLVRPHAVRDGKLGQIVQSVIQSGFDIVCCQMVQLTRPNAMEFFEVYKGVVPEYSEWVEEVVGGKCVALQVIFKEKPDASVLALRELCGAHDPEIASHLHQGSLRALFGENKTKNAVHCTDLPEDGPLEVEYFFSILPGIAVA